MKRTILSYFTNKELSASSPYKKESKATRSVLYSKSTLINEEVIVISSDEETEKNVLNSVPAKRLRLIPKISEIGKKNDISTAKQEMLCTDYYNSKNNDVLVELKKQECNSTSSSDDHHCSPMINENQSLNVHYKTNSEIDSSRCNSHGEFHQPYYLRNFKMAIDTVMKDAIDATLFDGPDADCIEKFMTLSVKAQCLYVRLFHRKLAWLSLRKITYNEICEDLTAMLDELVTQSFIQSIANNEEILTLSEVLHLLPTPMVKVLAKPLHVMATGHKRKMVADIEKLCNCQKSVVFSKHTLRHTILKRALKLLGPCYRVSLEPKQVFNRLLLVFDVTKGTEDDSEYSLAGSNQPPYYGKNQQLATILMTEMGKTVFPTYTISKVTPIFKSRCELLEYEKAYHLLIEVLNATEKSNWQLALELCEKADLSKSTLKEESINRAISLPSFMRTFTASAIYVKIKSLQVEILQRMKNYEYACKTLRGLLGQSDFSVSRRGFWAERLALNLDQHLQKHHEALDVIEQGLKDKYVRVGHVIGLVERAEKIQNSRKVPDYAFNRLLSSNNFCKAEEVTIVGRLLPKRMQTGKARFMKVCDAPGDNEDVLLCSVEELALDHYRCEGFDQGLHGEGGTFTCYFCLLFWDIIFMSGIEDVFRTPYQAHPLDYNTDDFYFNRKTQIDQRLKDISTWETSNFSVLDVMKTHWNACMEMLCTGMNWERFSSIEDCLVLAECIGSRVMSGIMKILAMDPRHTRSGLPDLVVWSSTSKTYKLIEVKGPGDRLSNNQKVWMHELVRLKANVEICHVSASASRKLT